MDTMALLGRCGHGLWVQPVTGFDHYEFENLIKLMKKRNVVECDRAGVAGGSLRLTLVAKWRLMGQVTLLTMISD
jgi:hypothetical protein